MGCAPPQLSNYNGTQICSTTEKIAESHQKLNYLTTADLQKYDVPCREIEKLHYEYTEDYATNQNRRNEPRDWFQIRLYFAETTFKYIEQVRSF